MARNQTKRGGSSKRWVAKATLTKDAAIQEVHKISSETGKVCEREIHWDTKQTTTGAESSLS